MANCGLQKEVNCKNDCFAAFMYPMITIHSFCGRFIYNSASRGAQIMLLL